MRYNYSAQALYYSFLLWGRYLTGQYNTDSWGRVTCCIDPRTGPWLLVTAEDGTRYLFGASEAGAAAEIAALLGAD